MIAVGVAWQFAEQPVQTPRLPTTWRRNLLRVVSSSLRSSVVHEVFDYFSGQKTPTPTEQVRSLHVQEPKVLTF
jgi:hypothetical protein